MKVRICFSTLLALVSLGLSAQEEEFNFNQLETPSNPAFIIMGNSNTEVEEPTSVSDLKASIQNATNNFSSLPSNYALSFAPGWLVSGSSIEFDRYLSNSSVLDNIWQSLVVSLGTSSFDENNEDFKRVGAGLRFSIIRGSVSDDLKNKFQNYFQRFHSDFNTALNKELKADTAYQNLNGKWRAALIANDTVKADTYAKKLSDRRQTITEQVFGKENKQRQLEELNNIKLTRSGFFLDVAGGGAWNFYNNDLDSSDFYRWALWTNFGWTWKKNKVIGLGRYMSFTNDAFVTPERVVDSLEYESLDLGMKYVWNPTEKFKLSGEGIYRVMLNQDMESTYKFMFNLAYDVGKNQIISLSLGRDFRGVYSRKEEGLIYLGYAIGLGNDRKLKS